MPDFSCFAAERRNRHLWHQGWGLALEAGLKVGGGGRGGRRRRRRDFPIYNGSSKSKRPLDQMRTTLKEMMQLVNELSFMRYSRNVCKRFEIVSFV